MKAGSRTSIMACAAVLALGIAAGASPAADLDTERLLESEKALSTRLETLRREQDFLVFQNSASSQDSKYLILNITEKTGQLKYKSRVLRDFPLLSESRNLQRLKQEALSLTGKVDGGPRRKNALLFGDSLVVIARGGDPGPHAKKPRLVLSRKDFRAVYYAIESGALLYVLP